MGGCLPPFLGGTVTSLSVNYCGVMDPSTRDRFIKQLEEQLELCRRQAASLDNDSGRRSEITETSHAIQLLLDFLQRKEGWQ